jgi:hypothetical protein
MSDNFMDQVIKETTNEWVEFMGNPENQHGFMWSMVAYNELPEGVDLTDPRVIEICRKAAQPPTQD